MDPRETHDMEQMGARIRDISRIVSVYRDEHMANGVPEDEAWERAKLLEASLIDVVVTGYDTDRMDFLASSVAHVLVSQYGFSPP